MGIWTKIKSFLYPRVNDIMMIRYLDLSDEVDATIARYVITNPPNDFKMHPTDKVIIIINIIILKIIRIAMIIGTIYIMKFVITNFQPL